MLFAARKFMRKRLGPVRKAKPLQPVAGGFAALLAGLAGQAKADIVDGVEVREQREILKDQADTAFFGRHMFRQRGDEGIAVADFPGIDGLQPCKQAQQRRFAGARLAEKRGDLARLQRQRGIIDDRAAVIAACHAARMNW